MRLVTRSAGWPHFPEGERGRRAVPVPALCLDANGRTAPVPWSDEQKAAFLEMQARAQHTDYQRNYAEADWLVIERGGADIGRLYLDRGNNSDSRHHIIDIAFLPEWRGKGLGGALLRDLLDEVGRSGKAMSIHVEKFNPAMRTPPKSGRPHPICREPSKRSPAQQWPHRRHGGSI
ncbi:MAG: hypothetical protein QOG66_1280 [Methylobacteriaceae bacterium]|jgi:ribosomal protein S18 acetylase RimI-like enzyme|nr:hypothetical protein [Methylobacteriaceae bacterium]